MADFAAADHYDRIYKEALVKLHAVFAEAGFECPRADKWIDIFRDWLDRGIISN